MSVYLKETSVDIAVAVNANIIRAVKHKLRVAVGAVY